MALQDRNALVLDALSILKDIPPHPRQSVLADGVHLRWSPGENRAFPLGGYYLFRRRIAATTPACLIPLLKNNKPAHVALQVSVVTAMGTLAANAGHLNPLPVAPAQPVVAAFSIDQGLQFSLPAGMTTSHFTVRLRFPGPVAGLPHPQNPRRCLFSTLYLLAHTV